MFKEITVTLPCGNRPRQHHGVRCDLDVTTEKAIDVYTDKRNYEEHASVLKS